MTFEPPTGPPISPGPPPPPPAYTLGSVMPAPVVRRPVHPASIVLAIVGGIALLCGGILAVGSIGAKAPTSDAASRTTTITVTVPASAAPVAAAPAVTTSSAPPPAPTAPTIREGTWTVGVDFPPGTYRTTADVSSTCYWKISKSGTNGSDIIENDLPGGGRPTVTLQAGQDFTTNRCGTWSLTG